MTHAKEEDGDVVTKYNNPCECIHELQRRVTMLSGFITMSEVFLILHVLHVSAIDGSEMFKCSEAKTEEHIACLVLLPKSQNKLIRSSGAKCNDTTVDCVCV